MRASHKRFTTRKCRDHALPGLVIRCAELTGSILLIPFGTVLFQEHVSLRMLAGTVLCTSGLMLLVRGTMKVCTSRLR